MDPQAAELYERAVQFLWDGDPDTAIAELDRAAAVASSEEMAERIVIRKAEALIAAGRDGAAIAALPA